MESSYVEVAVQSKIIAYSKLAYGGAPNFTWCFFWGGGAFFKKKKKKSLSYTLLNIVDNIPLVA